MREIVGHRLITHVFVYMRGVNCKIFQGGTMEGGHCQLVARHESDPHPGFIIRYEFVSNSLL
jgi:hypothetical protein